jgi:hypothetical protein
MTRRLRLNHCNRPVKLLGPLLNKPLLYPVVLDFDCEKSKLGGTFHDFELHNNGDVTAWKRSGVGPGKKFTKEKLDKKYVWVNEQSRELQAAAFDQQERDSRWCSR